MTMISSTLNTNDEILNRFARLIRKGQLAHAYFFVGPSLAGKSETALAIAKLINCDQPDAAGKFCNQCPICLRINSGNHPDVMLLETGEEQSIKVAKIRELIGRIQLRPFEARKKIFIIKDVENLTLEGSNALLKTLEEPAKDNLLILTTAAPDKVLATVKSRCHTVHFFAYAPSRLTKYLSAELKWPQEESHFLAFFSEGCLGLARRLNEEKFFAQKNEIIDNMLFHRNNEAYIKEIAADKERIREVLKVLFSWFRDVMLLKAAENERLIHLDRLRDLKRTETQYSSAQIEEILGAIVNTAKLVEDNLNVKIPLAILREKIWVK